VGGRDLRFVRNAGTYSGRQARTTRVSTAGVRLPVVVTPSVQASFGLRLRPAVARPQAPASCEARVRLVTSENRGHLEKKTVEDELADLGYRKQRTTGLRMVEWVCSVRESVWQMKGESTNSRMRNALLLAPIVPMTFMSTGFAQQRVNSDAPWYAFRTALWPHIVRHALGNAKSLSSKNVKGLLRTAARHTIPSPVRRWLRARLGHRPPLGSVDFGSLRRVAPVSRNFGRDRGRPIDRYYIEPFLAANADSIRGHVLEVDDNRYTRTFGGDRVTRSDVLHVHPNNPRATIVADLTRADHIASNRFDCIILTQTLPFIYDIHAVVRTLHRILKPGGVVLATVGGITPICRRDMERWGHYWSFTTLSARLLFEEAFPGANVRVDSFGNVLAATAFLHGLAAEELRPTELDYRDPDYEFLITIKAVKPKHGDEETAR
jgi:SAM-dependent methyltransferase